MGTIWEQFIIFAAELKALIMKVTAFIRKTAKKNDTDSMATIYFRLRDGKKDIKAASELVINPNHWSSEKQGYKDRVALVSEENKLHLSKVFRILCQGLPSNTRQKLIMNGWQ